MKSLALRILVLTWVWTTPFAASASTGQAGSPQVIAEAERLRNAGDLTAAAGLLGAELARQPEDGEIARLLAQTLYWLQDRAAAETLYEDILRRHPLDTASRLAYARMLAEGREFDRARALATPLLELPPSRVDATSLLGTIAYWTGDLTGAARFFERVLELNPAHPEALRQLGEIRSVSASWLRFSVLGQDDDQPLDYTHGTIEAGWFLTPLLPVAIRFEPRQYAWSNGTRQVLWDGEAGITHYAPALRMETEARGGWHRRMGTSPSADWRGALAVGFRLPGHLSIRAGIDRAPYLHTVSSLQTVVFSRTMTATGRLQHPRGWAGEWGLQQQRYPDGNTVRSAYGWQLVPLIFRGNAEARVGYAFSRDHSDESRFVLALTAPSGSTPSPVGRYDPYYTPSHVTKHSALIAAMVRPTGRVTVRVAGSYAVRATEHAPFLYQGTTGIERAFFSRSYFPRSTRGSVDLAVGPRVVISASGETGRTAFYTWRRAAVQLTYRLAASPSSRR